MKQKHDSITIIFEIVGTQKRYQKLNSDCVPPVLVIAQQTSTTTMPIVFHRTRRELTENCPRTVTVFSEKRAYLLDLCANIDAQGYAEARINKEPEYLADLKTWRVGYVLPLGKRDIHQESFRKAHDRAYRMTVKLRSEQHRRKSRELTLKYRKTGKHSNYVRVAERKLFYGTVPNLAQNSARQS